MVTAPENRAPSAVSSAFTPEGLLRPSAFPHGVTHLELRETHISWVILTGPFAYKIKKPVQWDFVDASSLARRRQLCEEELRLNRRLAADLYVDVVAITEEAGRLSMGGQGKIVEYAVKMQQFPATQELSALLECNAVSQQEFVDLAHLLAQFHDTVPKAACSLGFPHTDQLHDAVCGTLAVLLSHLDADTPPPEMSFLVDWTHDYLHESLIRLRAREQSGSIRECHGDLHARNIVRWHGHLMPFDCLEFNPSLRWIDVMNDVAFLVMDLTAHGRKDLAFTFLNAYLEHTGDYEGVRHLSFYAVYRALVRAMVDALVAQNDPAHRREYHDRLRSRIKTAASFVNRSPPALVIMHGPSGSGKSWLSEHLVPWLGAVRIRSDVERKRLVGDTARVVGGTAYEEGAYSPEFSHRTYARLFECAESCLNGGVDTIVDAAFLNTADRRLFRDLAMSRGFRFFILHCQADRAAMTERVTIRAQLREDASDAGVAVLNRQLQRIEPLCAEEQAHVIQISTTDPQASQKACAAICQRVG